jgi:hypothetical protein
VGDACDIDHVLAGRTNHCNLEVLALSHICPAQEK